jgi:hypothetical protein
MVLSAFADPERSPLGPGRGDYAEWSAMLYSELLGRLTEICDNVSNYTDLWAYEDESLRESEEVISSGRASIEEDPDLDLAVIRVPEGSPTAGGHLFAGNWRKGLHPMAIHNAIDSFRVIVITGDRYELYYRYESWVQYLSRKPLSRVDLAPLAEELNALETAGSSWKADKVGALTPVLRISGDQCSGIASARFIELAKAHLGRAEPAWDPYARPVEVAS